MSPARVVQSPDEPASILLVSPDSDDHQLLPKILNCGNWRWLRSQGCRQAFRLLRQNPVTVVIGECDQPDGRWQDLLERTQGLAAPPSLIVCSEWADEHLWAEVLGLGAYDVLVKPFDREEVLRVAFLAWQAWKRRAARSKSGSVTRWRSKASSFTA